jgi:hypothetical protein
MKLKKWEIKRLKKLVKKLDKVKLEMEEDVVPVKEEYIITNGLPETVKDIEKPQVGDIGRKKAILLSDAYEILKENAYYSSIECNGFVYLAQIEEMLK